MMEATIGIGAFIATLILVFLLVVGRVAIQRYGQRIGANEMDFEHRPELEQKRSLYKRLKKGYTIATVIVGLWVMLLGIRLIGGAQDGLLDARQHGDALTSSRLFGALGATVVLAGIGVIFVPLTLRWDYQPERILDARPARKIRTASATLGQSGADFSVLTDAIGDVDNEAARPTLLWYNARPAILWLMLAATAGILICYLMLFIAVVPMR
jgi:hypothetical protein